MIDFNGTYYDKEKLVLPWSTSLIHKGYQVSQYLLMKDYQPLFVEEHYLKVIAQMRILRMTIPMTYTPDLFHKVLLKYCNRCDVSDGVLRLSFFEQAEHKIAYVIEFLEAKNIEAVQMDLYNDFYIQEGRHRFVTTHFNRLYELASRYAYDQEMDGCFILNSTKQLADSNLGTVFCVKDQKVVTPSLTSGTLDLVSRIKMMEWIKQDNKYEVVEEDHTPFYLQKMDAVFLYSFKYGIIPVRQYRKKQYQVALCSYFKELVEKSCLIQ